LYKNVIELQIRAQDKRGGEEKSPVDLARDAKSAMKAAKILPEAREKARELHGQANEL